MYWKGTASAHGRYGMWSYPNDNLFKGGLRQKASMGRTHCVMEAERFVPLPPQLADASLALNNECLDTEVLESSGKFEP